MINFIDGLKKVKKYDIEKDPSKINLDLNEFDDEHTPSVYQAMINQINTVNITKYNYKNDIHDELLDRISRYSGVTPENILLTNGCDAAIKLVIDTVKASIVYIHVPTYRQYERFSSLRDLPIELVSEKDFMDFEPVPHSLIFICNPGQPSTKFYDLDIIAYYVKKFSQSYFVVDETYLDFMILTGKARSVAELIPTCSNLIITRSLSKAFGLAGLRIGYLISSNHNVEQFEKAFNNKDVCCIVKSAALEVFRNIEWYKKLSHKMYLLQKNITDFMLKNGEDVENSPCNFILLNNRELHEYLEKHGIIIRDIGNNRSRLTIPGEKNAVKLMNILAKYYLLKHLDIWVICLEDRNDKYEYVSKELEKHCIIGLKWHRPKKDPRGGEFGCWESHKFCIQNSSKDLVLIFEDDVKFSSNISDFDWCNLYDFLMREQGTNWDTFFLGSTIMGIEKETGSKGICKLRCNQAHAYIVKREVGSRSDFCPDQHQGGVDDYYRRYTNQYGLMEPICIQKEGFVTDNQWYDNNIFQSIFQHPNLYELFQVKSNQLAKYLRVLPLNIQSWFNPIPCFILFNAGISQLLSSKNGRAIIL